jgi:hypothetical protein
MGGVGLSGVLVLDSATIVGTPSLSESRVTPITIAPITRHITTTRLTGRSIQREVNQRAFGCAGFVCGLDTVVCSVGLAGFAGLAEMGIVAPV